MTGPNPEAFPFDEASSHFPSPHSESLDHRMIGPWTRLSTAVPYDNAWIRVEHHEVLDPSGRAGVYGVVRYKHIALGVVPLHDDGTVTLVGQHRYALDSWSWEIPEGGGRLDKDPLTEAQRELLEETGLEAAAWRPLGLVHLSNSVSDETGHLWLAEGLVQHVPCPESTEELRLWRLPLAEAIEMALDGRITDSMSVIALLRVAQLLGPARDQSVTET